VLSPTERLEIAELVTRADAMATRRDEAGYANLFTDDAVLDGAEGTHQGGDRLRSDVMGIWEGEGEISVHLTLNVEVHEVEGSKDQATSDSVLVILAGEGATAVRTVARITQTFVRVGATWKISRRFVQPFGSTSEQ
jgi:ketosteroid isomerase-like protein